MLQARKPSVNRTNYLSVERPGKFVQEKAKKQVGRKIQLLVIFFTCFILCLIVIGQYSSLVITNYRLNNIKNELQESRMAVRSLEIEAAALGSINRISVIAQDKLGMAEPSLEQLRVLTVAQGENSRQGE